MNAGISFSPAQNAQPGQMGSGATKPGATPLQDAIKLLSFKLPTNVGAAAPSPSQIMGGPTALGAQLGNGVANNWLMALFRGLNPAATGGFQAHAPVPTWNPGMGDMAPMGTAQPTGGTGGDPNAMGAGSAMPGATPPPGRTAPPVAVRYQPNPPTPSMPTGPSIDRPWLPGPDFQQFGG